MTEQRWGVTIPLMGVSLAEHRRYLDEIAELGFTDVWSSEAGAHDAFTPLALTAAWTPSWSMSAKRAAGSQLPGRSSSISHNEAGAHRPFQKMLRVPLDAFLSGLAPALGCLTMRGLTLACAIACAENAPSTADNRPATSHFDCLIETSDVRWIDETLPDSCGGEAA